MRYYLDMPDEQIADILGCRKATVRSHAAQGLAALRIDLAVGATSTYGSITSSESRRS